MDVQLFPKQLSSEEFQQLYKLVIAQLAKDFQPYSQPQPAPVLVSPEWIFLEIKRMLAEVISKENSALGYIIYRVDIPEWKLSKATLGYSGEQKMDALANLVLKREALKVWIRHNYSSE